MAKKVTGLFYELTLRGNFGGEHQSPNNLGVVEGAHYIESEAEVDDDGRLIPGSYRKGQAQPLPLDKLREYLGKLSC